MTNQDLEQRTTLPETIREIYTGIKLVFKETPYIYAGVGAGAGLFSYLAFRQSDYLNGITLAGISLAAIALTVGLISERIKEYQETQRAEELWKTHIEPALEERWILPYRH